QLLGDGLMAIFGAPLSFGNDATNAVHAALEIVERVQREVDAQRIPPTRIGIGLYVGEVLAGTVGSALHKEYNCTGDVVNLASRIEHKLSSSVRRQMPDRAAHPGRIRVLANRCPPGHTWPDRASPEDAIGCCRGL